MFTRGTPEIKPVVVLNEIPDGKDGETLKLLAGPPELLGIRAFITEAKVRLTEFDEYEMFGGAKVAATSMDIWTESLPALLVAVTVYTVVELVAVGVPEIWPVKELNASPAGSDGDTVQLLDALPPFVGNI